MHLQRIFSSVQRICHQLRTVSLIEWFCHLNRAWGMWKLSQQTVCLTTPGHSHFYSRRLKYQESHSTPAIGCGVPKRSPFEVSHFARTCQNPDSKEKRPSLLSTRRGKTSSAGVVKQCGFFSCTKTFVTKQTQTSLNQTSLNSLPQACVAVYRWKLRINCGAHDLTFSHRGNLETVSHKWTHLSLGFSQG